MEVYCKRMCKTHYFYPCYATCGAMRKSSIVVVCSEHSGALEGIADIGLHTRIANSK